MAEVAVVFAAQMNDKHVFQVAQFVFNGVACTACRLRVDGYGFRVDGFLHLNDFVEPAVGVVFNTVDDFRLDLIVEVQQQGQVVVLVAVADECHEMAFYVRQL